VCIGRRSEGGYAELNIGTSIQIQLYSKTLFIWRKLYRVLIFITDTGVYLKFTISENIHLSFTGIKQRRGKLEVRALDH